MSLITIALEKKIYALPRNIHSSSLFIIIIIIWLSYLTLHNVMNFVYIFSFGRYKYENNDDADGMRCVYMQRDRIHTKNHSLTKWRIGMEYNERKMLNVV